MSFAYEEDRLQCSAMTDKKKRCNLIGTHSNGGKVLCERHHQIYIRNNSLTKEKQDGKEKTDQRIPR